MTSHTITALVLATSATFTPANGQTFNETLKLLASDGATADLFGDSVAISGNTAIVGAAWDADNGMDSGSAYLFDVTTGSQIRKLLPNDGVAFDRFGNSVAISGNIAIVGAHQNDDNGADSGSAYLFDITTGVQFAKLLPGDGAAGDGFGRSVAIDGTTAIIGARDNDDFGTNSGSAYLFDTTTGLEIAKLLPNDGALQDGFGRAIAISGAIAIVGSFNDDDNGPDSGSAYLFDATTGLQLAKLLPGDGAADDWFGRSVEIDGSTAIVGSRLDDDNGTNSGSAYLFDVTAGVELFKLLPGDGAANDRFGFSVAISGATAIVGSPKDDDLGSISGAAYLFDASTGFRRGKLLPSDGAAGDWFGLSVAIDGVNAIVGAAADDDYGADSGSAYLFDAVLFPGASFCFGDGTGTPCPCGNSGAAGEGCANDTGAGALLSASGSNSVSGDNLVLSSTGLTPGPGLYFQGNNAINSGNGNPFGDGLRCAGNQVIRLEVRFASGGASATTISVAAKGGVSAGQTKRYQLWYRDSGVSPCNSLFNLSNGYEITWTL